MNEKNKLPLMKNVTPLYKSGYQSLYPNNNTNLSDITSYQSSYLDNNTSSPTTTNNFGTGDKLTKYQQMSQMSNSSSSIDTKSPNVKNTSIDTSATNNDDSSPNYNFSNYFQNASGDPTEFGKNINSAIDWGINKFTDYNSENLDQVRQIAGYDDNPVDKLVLGLQLQNQKGFNNVAESIKNNLKGNDNFAAPVRNTILQTLRNNKDENGNYNKEKIINTYQNAQNTKETFEKVKGTTENIVEQGTNFVKNLF